MKWASNGSWAGSFESCSPLAELWGTHNRESHGRWSTDINVTKAESQKPVSTVRIRQAQN